MRIVDPRAELAEGTLSPELQGSMKSTDSIGERADPRPSWIMERARVAVNRNVTVAGHLVFQEPIRIDGHFRGEVSSSELVVISENGSVGGRVRSPRLIVLGQLEGDITASRSVVLGPHSRFKGKIEADNLTICEGAFLEGELRIGCRANRPANQNLNTERERSSVSA
jgi:cytoskeletal protein CcmA (bactofilin family)